MNFLSEDLNMAKVKGTRNGFLPVWILNHYTSVSIFLSSNIGEGSTRWDEKELSRLIKREEC